MSLNVTALARGGLTAYGQGRFDARDNIVICNVLQDEVLDVRVRFADAPTEFDYEENGISAGAPAITGDTIAVQFQTISSGGQYDLLAMFATGAVRRIRFVADPLQPPCVSATVTATDDDDVDYGDWG